jgi:hypothetical protein
MAETSKFEQNIEELKQRIEAQRPRIEAEGDRERREDVVRGEIQEFISEVQSMRPAQAPPQVIKQKAAGIQTLPPSQKLGALITMTFEDGIETAISIARALDDPAILDEMHDTLVDSFYKELIEREIIKIP